MPKQHQQEAAPPEVAEIEPEAAPGSWEQVRGMVDAIQPGDWMRVLVFLQTYPKLSDQIIAEAQTVVGNARSSRRSST